jgi:hypothetical protein
MNRFILVALSTGPEKVKKLMLVMNVQFFTHNFAVVVTASGTHAMG